MAHQIDSIVPNHSLTGVNVLINGSGFGAVQGGSSVVFSPSETAPVVVWSDTQLQVTVPAASVTGEVRVIVGAAEAVSPRNAAFWRLEAAQFPVSLDEIEAQNEDNDTNPEDLLIADAADYNELVEILDRIQKKVGIDGSLDATTLDAQVARSLTKRRDRVTFFVPVPGGGLPFPAPVPLGLHSLADFPPGVVTEMLARSIVANHAKNTGGELIEVLPLFTISAPPLPGDTVVLDLFGDAGTTPLPPNPTIVGVDTVTAGSFAIGPSIMSLPIVTAPPNTPLAFIFQRIGTDVSDIYGGAFQLDALLFEFEV